MDEVENIKELTGDYLPVQVQKTILFEPKEDNKAYERMTSFISWVKPTSFNVRSGTYEDGSTVVELTYVFADK